MKIPSSSSILLAGLAISSSSSCLAAPTRDGTQDVGISSSSSTSYASSSVAPAAYPTGVNAQERSDAIGQRDANPLNNLAARDTLLDPVIDALKNLPILGPLLERILGKAVSQTSKSLDVENPGSNQLQPEDMEALQNAIDEVSRMIALATAQGVVGNDTLPSAPVSAQSDGDGSGTAPNPSVSASGAPPGPTEAAAADDGSDPNANTSASPSYSSASAAPSSPAMPGNPPNTPNPGLPVNP